MLAPLATSKSPMITNLVNYGTNWCAVVLAGFCNFYSLRRGELVTGIHVKLLNIDEEFGMSQVAAHDAIKKACIARVLFTLPTFTLPLLLNTALSRVNMLPRSGSPMRIFSECLCVGSGLYIAIGLN